MLVLWLKMRLWFRVMVVLMFTLKIPNLQIKLSQMVTKLRRQILIQIWNQWNISIVVLHLLQLLILILLHLKISTSIVQRLLNCKIPAISISFMEKKTRWSNKAKGDLQCSQAKEMKEVLHKKTHCESTICIIFFSKYIQSASLRML